MPPGELIVTCPNCQHRTNLPFDAIKRDNYYCSKCLQKVPLQGIRPQNPKEGPPIGARRKKSSRGYRR